MSVHEDKRTGALVVKIRDASGKQIAVTVNARNLSEHGIAPAAAIGMRHALMLEQALTLRVRGASAAEDPCAVSVEEACERFIATRMCKETSRYSYALKKLLAQQLAGRPVNRATREDVEAIIKKLFDEEKAFDTVLGYFRDISSFFKWCTDNDVVERNPTRGIRLPRRPRRAPRYLSDAEVRELIEATAGTPIELAVLLGLNLGCRRGELAGLRWADVDFRTKKVRIHGTKTDAAEREVPLFPALERVLEPLRSVGSAFVLAKDETGKSLKSSGLSTRVRRFRDDSDLDLGWCLKFLRRTYGAMLLKSGYRMEQVSRLLGHTSIEITQRWYVQLTKEDLLASLPEGYQGVSAETVKKTHRVEVYGFPVAGCRLQVAGGYQDCSKARKAGE